MQLMSSPDFVQAQMGKIHDENIEPVTQLCLKLQDGVPGSRVPLIDPVHDLDETRIISLQISPSPGTSSGFLSLQNDDPTAERLAEVYAAAGLDHKYGMPWNVHPWDLPEEQNTALTPKQIKTGVKPFKQFLELTYRASAVVAHGTQAVNLINDFKKVGGDLILRERGIKVYAVRATGGRSFIGSEANQKKWFDEMVAAYTDAMGRAGLRRNDA